MEILALAVNIRLDEMVFIDSDLLFRYFAISGEKKTLYDDSGSTGNEDLDTVIALFQQIEDANQYVCISEFSILELVCLLNRLNSVNKIPRILNTLYQVADICPINDNMMTLAWHLGANFKLHSGDSLHASFCLLNDVDIIFLSDNEFVNSFRAVQQDFIDNGIETIAKTFNAQIPIRLFPSMIAEKRGRQGTVQGPN